MQTPPPSWSVAAIRRWRCADLKLPTRADISAGVEALWFRFTTSSPPNWRRFQSAMTAAVAGPLKPTIITAPTSSSSVSPPGPSCTAMVGDGRGGMPVGDGCDLIAAPLPQPASSAASSSRLAGLLTRKVAFGQLPAQPGLDELVDLAVLQHGLDVALLDTGPDVLHQRVGLEGVVADLGAELGRQHLALQVVDLLGRQQLLALEEPGPQHLHRDLAVLDLRALVLAGDHDAGRQVRDADRRLGLVDVLAARPARAIGVDTKVLGVDRDHRLLLFQLRHHLNQSKRRMAPMVLVEGRDPDQPVDAVLGAQQPVGAGAADQQCHAFEARLLSRRRLQHL